MAISTITAAVGMPHGTAAGRAGLFRAASVSRIAMVHGTTHLIIGTGTDNQLKAAFGRPSFSLFSPRPQFSSALRFTAGEFASSASSVFGSTRRKANCADALDKMRQVSEGKRPAGAGRANALTKKKPKTVNHSADNDCASECPDKYA